MRDDGCGPARSERRVEHGRLAAEVRHAACDLAQVLVTPRQGPYVRLPGKKISVGVGVGIAGRKDGERLEVTRGKVYRRRDVVGVRDVHVSAREGVFLRMQV